MTAVVILLVVAILAVIVWEALYRKPAPPEEWRRRDAEERLRDRERRNVRRLKP